MEEINFKKGEENFKSGWINKIVINIFRERRIFFSLWEIIDVIKIK